MPLLESGKFVIVTLGRSSSLSIESEDFAQLAETNGIPPEKTCRFVKGKDCLMQQYQDISPKSNHQNDIIWLLFGTWHILTLRTCIHIYIYISLLSPYQTRSSMAKDDTNCKQTYAPIRFETSNKNNATAPAGFKAILFFSVFVSQLVFTVLFQVFSVLGLRFPTCCLLLCGAFHPKSYELFGHLGVGTPTEHLMLLISQRKANMKSPNPRLKIQGHGWSQNQNSSPLLAEAFILGQLPWKTFQ